MGARMTRAEAEAECKRLAAASPDRDIYRWEPTEVAKGDWQVAKIGPFPPRQEATGTATRPDEKPTTQDDMRPPGPHIPGQF